MSTERNDTHDIAETMREQTLILTEILMAVRNIPEEMRNVVRRIDEHEARIRKLEGRYRA